MKLGEKKSKEPETTIPKKERVNPKDLVMLEQSLSLQVISTFEQNFINNLQTRYFEYGPKMVITKDQRKILKELSDRYSWAYFDLLSLELDEKIEEEE